jgi:hypothetical protein
VADFRKWRNNKVPLSISPLYHPLLYTLLRNPPSVAMTVANKQSVCSSVNSSAPFLVLPMEPTKLSSRPRSPSSVSTSSSLPLLGVQELGSLSVKSSLSLSDPEVLVSLPLPTGYGTVSSPSSLLTSSVPIRLYVFLHSTPS